MNPGGEEMMLGGVVDGRRHPPHLPSGVEYQVLALSSDTLGRFDLGPWFKPFCSLVERFLIATFCDVATVGFVKIFCASSSFRPPVMG